jgi:hypothetical protein
MKKLELRALRNELSAGLNFADLPGLAAFLTVRVAGRELSLLLLQVELSRVVALPSFGGGDLVFVFERAIWLVEWVLKDFFAPAAHGGPEFEGALAPLVHDLVEEPGFDDGVVSLLRFLQLRQVNVVCLRRPPPALFDGGLN